MTGPGSSFDFMRMLRRALGFVVRNFSPSMILALLLAGVPQLALLSTAFAATLSSDKAAVTVAAYVLSAVSFLGALLLQAALTRSMADDADGKAVSVGTALQTAAGAALALSGLLLVFLAILAAAIGVLRYFYVFLVYSGWLMPALGLMYGLAAVLALFWGVAPPVVARERTGVFGALRRSAGLTSGHRLAVFGVVLLCAGLSVAGPYAVGLLLPGVSSVMAEGVVTAPLIAAVLVVVAIGAFTALMVAVCVVSLYFELRQAKGGAAPSSSL